MRKAVVTALSALLLTTTGPRAAEIPVSERGTLESYAEANKTCGEWSDGCAVCRRHDDGAFACSLPGIACEPTLIACRDTKSGAGAPDATTNNRPSKSN